MKLSSRKQLLREATDELNKINSSIRLSSIKEPNRIDEFNLTGKTATALKVWCDGIFETYMSKYIRKSYLKEIETKVQNAIKKVGEKYGGEVKIHYEDFVKIDFDSKVDTSKIQKMYLDIKSAVEPMINLNLFELDVKSYFYKSSGVMGTNLGRGEVTKWIIGKDGDSSIGHGESSLGTFEKNIDNVLSEFPSAEQEMVMEKIDRICLTYFKDKSVLTKDTDWVKELTTKIEQELFGTKKS